MATLAFNELISDRKKSLLNPFKNIFLKHEKTKAFLIFPGGIEGGQWHEMV